MKYRSSLALVVSADVLAVPAELVDQKPLVPHVPLGVGPAAGPRAVGIPIVGACGSLPVGTSEEGRNGERGNNEPGRERSALESPHNVLLSFEDSRSGKTLGRWHIDYSLGVDAAAPNETEAQNQDRSRDPDQGANRTAPGRRPFSGRSCQALLLFFKDLAAQVGRLSESRTLGRKRVTQIVFLYLFTCEWKSFGSIVSCLLAKTASRIACPGTDISAT